MQKAQNLLFFFCYFEFEKALDRTMVKLYNQVTKVHVNAKAICITHRHFEKRQRPRNSDIR